MAQVVLAIVTSLTAACRSKGYALTRSTWTLLRRHLWTLLALFAICDLLTFAGHRLSHRLTNEGDGTLLVACGDKPAEPFVPSLLVFASVQPPLMAVVPVLPAWACGIV